MSKKIEVQILGNYFSFNLPSDVEAKDFIDIIDFVENKINLIRRSSSDLDSYKLALLASINIAEELFTLKKENEELKGFLNKIDSIVPKLDIIDSDNERPVKLLPEQ
jgi:cell division protein ZapA (FtsZ GTPase activity inhibitor)